MHKFRPAPAVFVLALAACTGTGAHKDLPPPPAPPAPAPTLNISVEYYRLANGLRVVLSHDAAVPTTTIAVYYHIGFRS